MQSTQVYYLKTTFREKKMLAGLGKGDDLGRAEGSECDKIQYIYIYAQQMKDLVCSSALQNTTKHYKTKDKVWLIH